LALKEIMVSAAFLGREPYKREESRGEAIESDPELAPRRLGYHAKPPGQNPFVPSCYVRRVVGNTPN
jgi:hypothetical protein